MIKQEFMQEVTNLLQQGGFKILYPIDSPSV